MSVRFQEAYERFILRVRSAQEQELAGSGQLIVVRDLWGRLSLLIENAPRASLEALSTALQEDSGPFFGAAPQHRDELFAPELFFDSPDRRPIPGAPRIQVLERALTSADWLRSALPNREPRPPRATLYGIKGGVGRSTALCAWARHLAKLGKRVLVVDLDLESPGVSSTLLQPEATADFGVVDWLVEDAVGNADETLVRLMVAPSPLSRDTPGRVSVVPCGGSSGSAGYMAKLARAYLDVSPPDGSVRTFADRLGEMLDALEAEHRPDVVLLDSRAGLHDIAAVTITRLQAHVFLFAVGTRQTWDAYGVLFSQWQSSPIGAEIRERLKIVAAHIPEEGRKEYLRSFETAAYRLLLQTLYDPERPLGTSDSAATPLPVFNFDLRDPAAPHHRLPIYWNRVFQDWNPLDDAVSDDQLGAAFGEFLRGATSRLGIEA